MKQSTEEDLNIVDAVFKDNCDIGARVKLKIVLVELREEKYEASERAHKHGAQNAYAKCKEILNHEAFNGPFLGRPFKEFAGHVEDKIQKVADKARGRYYGKDKF